jgi:hypothetical protein
MIGVALTAERISAALRTAIRADRSSTVRTFSQRRLAAGHTDVGITRYKFDLAIGIHSKQVHTKMPPDSVKSWGIFVRLSPKQPISHDFRRSCRLAGCLTPAPAANSDRQEPPEAETKGRAHEVRCFLYHKFSRLHHYFPSRSVSDQQLKPSKYSDGTIRATCLVDSSRHMPRR